MGKIIFNVGAVGLEPRLARAGQVVHWGIESLRIVHTFEPRKFITSNLLYFSH